MPTKRQLRGIISAHMSAAHAWRAHLSDASPSPSSAASSAGAAAAAGAAELRKLCERGIPPELRCDAWPRLLSTRAALQPTADEYELLRMAAVERISGSIHEEFKHTRLIEVDLARTFPRLGFFGEGGPLRGRLRELLWVYCLLPDGLPYRQGMSHLAATLLLHLQDDAHLACASLHALLGGYPILRAAASLRLAPSLRFFEAGARLACPASARRLAALEIGPELYFIPWVVTLFTRSLPLALACRVWDRVLSEGERALFRAALALLSLLEPALAAASFDDAVRLLQHLPPIDGDELLAAMGKVALPEEEYEALLVDAIVNGATPDN